MRKINKIVIHCSATKESQWVDIEEIYRWHKKRGFREIGYHFVIKLDGSIEVGRTIDEIGAHAKGHNHDSIGVCYIGGLDSNGKAKDTRNTDQRKAMDNLITRLKNSFPNAEIIGHRDLSVDLNGDGVISRNEWMKECPCFDVKSEYK